MSSDLPITSLAELRLLISKPAQQPLLCKHVDNLPVVNKIASQNTLSSTARVTKLAQHLASIAPAQRASMTASVLLLVLESLPKMRRNQDACWKLARHGLDSFLDFSEQMEGRDWDSAPPELLNISEKLTEILQHVYQFIQTELELESKWHSCFSQQSTMLDTLIGSKARLGNVPQGLQTATLTPESILQPKNETSGQILSQEGIFMENLSLPARQDASFMYKQETRYMLKDAASANDCNEASESWEMIGSNGAIEKDSASDASCVNGSDEAPESWEIIDMDDEHVYSQTQEFDETTGKGSSIHIVSDSSFVTQISEGPSNHASQLSGDKAAELADSMSPRPKDLVPSFYSNAWLSLLLHIALMFQLKDNTLSSCTRMLKARALYSYTASAEDPNEVSFAKGEIIDIIDAGGKWWQARKPDGTVGIVPSNYLRLMDSPVDLGNNRATQSSENGTPSLIPSYNIVTVKNSSVSHDPLITYKATALYAYTASDSDPSEISFSKGEILDIVNKHGKWWQAKKFDGTTGIVPSNYMQIEL